ncbi:MAG: AI-2E family transporter [Planctomycetota bacterium]|nr:AI-2E family transporter [Planctomycetota bacterium]
MPAMREDGQRGQGLRVLIGAAATIVLIAGLKLGAPVLVPITLAAVFAIVSVRPIKWLMARGVPAGLAMFFTLIGLMAVVAMLLLLVIDQVEELVAAAPEYQGGITVVVDDVREWLETLGIEFDTEPDSSKKATNRVLQIVGSAVSDLVGLLGNFLLILLIALFILLEANALPNKLRRAFPGADSELGAVNQILDQVYDYVFLKTVISLITGALFGFATFLIGVDFPFLWGLLAFVFNFIPNVGSVLAAIPACIFAYLQLGPQGMVFTLIANVGINQVIGNLVEPRVMGNRLGLSPLVVFVSLIFWGYVWGMVGVLLSTPLTMVVKIACENVQDLRWLAVLLGPSDPDATEAAERAPA